MQESKSDGYMQKVVGFVDILGFADLVQCADSNPDLRIKVMEALGKAQAIKPDWSTGTEFQAHYFSDSLIVSAQHSPEGLWHLLLSLDALAWNLLKEGILVRGAVTIGGIFHDERFVFGVGVNKAYHLESTVAKVPRIILGKDAIDAVKCFAANGSTWETYRDSRIRRDSDGVNFLNFLCEFGCFNRQESIDPNATNHLLSVAGRSIQSFLQRKIDTTLEQPDIYAKIEWFARYWNSEVAPEPNHASEVKIGPIILPSVAAGGPTLPFRAHGSV